MNTHDQSLASAAAAYFEARDAARKEDKRRRQREKDACPKGDDFTFNGQKVFSLAHMETMRPSEPMTPDELQDAIERLQRGNALLIEEFPAKLSAFDDAMQRARMHFAQRDDARRAAGIPDAADDDDARWSSIQESEVAAYRPSVRTHADAVAFLKLLADFFRETGVNDIYLNKLIPARLGEAITLLSHAQQ